MTETYKIEKNIPEPARTDNSKYPFLIMEIGDSFFHPGESQKLSGAANQCFRRTGRKFTVRKVVGGARCWRIK